MAVSATFENAERNGIAHAQRNPDNAWFVADLPGVHAWLSSA
jgi:hypothetical protein